MIKKVSSINLLSIICILGMFSVMSLLLILLGANFYQNITDKVTENDEIRTSLNYVANKIRFSGADKVDIKEINNVKVLKIQQEDYIDLIYFYDRNIMEVSLISEDDFVPEYGTSIIPINLFEFNKTNDGFITFSTQSNSDNPIKLKVYTDNIGGIQ